MSQAQTIDMIDSTESPATTGAPIPQAILKAQAIAAYIAGNSWPTWNPYIAARPDLVASGRAVSITLTARARARCLDIEPGGATPSQAPGWYLNFADHTFGLPILYTYASQVQAVINAMSAAGIPRCDYLVWSAHPSGGRHICGPDAHGPANGCGYPQADGTQYATVAGNCDISIMAAYCFAPVSPLPLPPLPPGVHPMSIALQVKPDGNVIVACEATAAQGHCGEVFLTWSTQPGNADSGPVMHGTPGKTPHAWESLGTPGT